MRRPRLPFLEQLLSLGIWAALIILIGGALAGSCLLNVALLKHQSPAQEASPPPTPLPPPVPHPM